ncbi:putative cross-wall-targeting lipoprotein signal domain-containing protein, partial [Streptococcus suis]
MSQNVKSIFGYRKNKAGQLCGAVLAAGLLSVSLSAGQQAFADEVQTADSEVSTVAENQEIQTATRADVEAANTQLETAVTNA